MGKYYKRCTRCDLSAAPSLNENHPLFLTSPDAQTYHSVLVATRFSVDPETGDTICSHCTTAVDEMLAEFEEDERDE